MQRMTQATDNPDTYTVATSCVKVAGTTCHGPAIDRLARFENAYESLLARQDKIAADLEQLKSQGRSQTVSFKQLLAEKLLNQSILVLLRSYGLD
ncbi:MAG: hypothetical protein EOM08_12785 [Clostridia bacterium]|nr:hypothetical protein [Clostridia bacterium]NCC77297.1 hypothetical protein [Clostridia bacterium]